MCSVGDDFDNNENGSNNHMSGFVKPVLADLKCNKCRETHPIVLLRSKDAYCKNCFLIGTNHKFKSLLGKSKLIRPNDKVMISYEIGHPSTALLHLIRTGLDLDTPKKLRFVPVFVFLEDQYHLSVSERNEAINSIIKEINKFKFNLFIAPFIEWILKKDIPLSENLIHINENDKETFNSLFKANANKSNKKETFNILRRNALIHIAKKLDCKFIFTPELSIDIASHLLTNIAMGKGEQISVDTGFCDNRDEVKILRPLRMFDIKEVAFYNTLHKLNPVSVNQPTINNYSSVQDLMKKFVSDLQDGYPATVTTIVKTGDKLITDMTISQKCKLCKGVIINKSEELDSEESTNFSKLVSNSLPDHNVTRQERYKEIIKTFNDNEQIRSEYCYSCSKISEYLLDEEIN